MAQAHPESVVYLPPIAGVLGLLVVVGGAIVGLEFAAVGWLLLLIAIAGSGAVALLRARRTPG